MTTATTPPLPATDVIDVGTGVGLARLHIDHARRPCRVLVLGHGAGGGPGGGVGAADLAAAAHALPELGTTVVRVEQPWRVAGRPVAVAAPRLDEAWLAALAHLPPSLAGLPLVVGGRSAGARVACRTAGQVGACGVLALAFPLHPPGRPERSRASEVGRVRGPLRVVQGTRDPFGGPPEFPGRIEVVGVAGADHCFAVGRSGPLTAAEALEVVVDAMLEFLAGMPRAGTTLAQPC
jgi:predicted alpha/beta-hydrolase family hydrolase